MDAYPVLKWLHVMSVVAWVGGGIGLLALQVTMQRAGDATALTGLATHSASLGSRYFAPLSVVTLVTGVGAVLLGEWGFTRGWVPAGFAGVLISGALAGGVGTRTERAIAEAVATHGYDSPAVAGLRRRHRTIIVTDLVLLTAVILAMVAKPG